METTEEHFGVFKFEVQHWLKYFHLGDWDVNLVHGPPDDGESGSCFCDYAQKHAIIRLSDNVALAGDESEEALYDEIRLVAFHEVCELLLGEIRQLMIYRFVTPEMVENSIHSCISRLTNSVYKGGCHADSTGCNMREQRTWPKSIPPSMPKVSRGRHAKTNEPSDRPANLEQGGDE